MLKICDLGTAIDRDDAATARSEITPYLVSRFYRAPEIILGMHYDYGVDMWSIGCTLYELYTGKILFTGDSNNQMLKAIMEIRGRLTPKLFRRGQLSGGHFDDMGHFISVERDKVLGKVRFIFPSFIFWLFFFSFGVYPFQPFEALLNRLQQFQGSLVAACCFYFCNSGPSGHVLRPCLGLCRCQRL